MVLLTILLPPLLVLKVYLSMLVDYEVFYRGLSNNNNNVVATMLYNAGAEGCNCLLSDYQSESVIKKNIYIY